MEYSERYTNNLVEVFSGYASVAMMNGCITGVTFDNHNIFNKMFIINISSDEIEIPTFARFIVEATIKHNLNHLYPNISRIVIPMYTNTPECFKRTADSIVNLFFSMVNFNERLQKVTTGGGEVYYGGRGIILDKDFNILLLCTLMCRKVELNNIKVMSYYKPVIHVNPQVFLRDKDPMCKSIIKKIIPFYISHTINFINTSNCRFRSDIPAMAKPQILINDVNKFIETPTKPSPRECLNEALNKILIDNIDDVLDNF